MALTQLGGKLRCLAASLFEVGDRQDRVASLEGLRGLAILLVFLCHYYDIIWRDLPSQSRAFSKFGLLLVGAGGTGVDLFFVLSGFLIYGAVCSPRFNARRFIVRRAVRIYPAFLAVLLLY